MSWTFYAMFAAAALAALDVSVKLGTGRLPDSLGTLIYGAFVFGVGLIWFVAGRRRGAFEYASTGGVVHSLVGGVAFSTAAVSLYGAGLIVASLSGVVIWNEPVAATYVVGLHLNVTGVYLIVTR
jgi:hypothetical protein